jgi:thioredoxin reductase (NADPH)
MMETPVILLVDNDSATLQTLADAMNRRYGVDYQIVSEPTPADALLRVRTVVKDGQQLALVMAEQSMPGMTGIDLLASVREIDWHVKRILLVELGNQPVQRLIPQAISLGQIDAYLERPWGSPEFRLYPLVGELLSEWARTDRVEAGWVRVVGDELSPQSLQARDLLNRNGVPFHFYDAASAEGKQVLKEYGQDGSRLPVFIMFDGRVLVEPSNVEAATALGAHSKPQADRYDVAIIGGGPAGLAAAVYGASEGLGVMIIEHEAPGGQAGTTSLIRNYLGFPRGISGRELTGRALEQAFLFGAEWVYGNRAVGLSPRGDEVAVRLASDDEVVARAVIIATGVTYRRLGIATVERLQGRGVYYGAAVTEAPAMSGRHVFIVGAGNSAGQAAVHFSRYAKRVTLVVRGSSLGASMSDYLVKEIGRSAKIEVRFDTQVVDAQGERRLQGLTLRHGSSGKTEQVAADALFLMIGGVPNTDWLAGIVERDERGYVLTGADLPRSVGAPRWPLQRTPLLLETSMPGVFAAGDLRHGAVPRVTSAVAEGALAIKLVHELLADQGSDAARSSPQAVLERTSRG